MYPLYQPADTYRILALDPGTNTLGSAFLDVDLVRQSMVVAGATTYKAASMSLDYDSYRDTHGDRAARLRAHEENLVHLMAIWRPHAVVCESSFMGKFAQAYAALVECICSIQRATYRYNPSLPLIVIDPTTVKKSTGMVGPLRGKDPVRDALRLIPYLQYAPGINLEALDEHSVDAIAIAHWRAAQVLQWLRDSPYEHRRCAG
jgi:Holliday junction resolvasome RuvABC endonuclease subunit